MLVVTSVEGPDWAVALRRLYWRYWTDAVRVLASWYFLENPGVSSAPLLPFVYLYELPWGRYGSLPLAIYMVAILALSSANCAFLPDLDLGLLLPRQPGLFLIVLVILLCADPPARQPQPI
jgi:hypothetical protein